MSHFNDARPELREWEREDQKHLRHSFGYWRMVEKRMHRAKLIKEGLDPADPHFEFRVDDLIREFHKSDETFQEGSERRARVAAEQEARRFALGETERSLSFDRAELELIVFRFEAANDPVGQSILRKAMERLG